VPATIIIRDLARSELDQAAALLGRGMRDNPLHLAVFGPEPARREAALTRFFRPVLRQIERKGSVIGAFRSSALVGVCALTAPARCRATPMEKLRIVPALLFGNNPRVLPAVLKWTGAWQAHDPESPHWHLGPVAVDRDVQRQGIGGQLLTEFCHRIERIESNPRAYLETDKRANVTFYEKHGFAVTGEEQILGVQNWYMER
jgi:ribosomal protein S18 acetylase RimI-like enzyme